MSMVAEIHAEYVAACERAAKAEAEAKRLAEAATSLVLALNTRDGRAFMHRDAGLDAHWKKLRDVLGIETRAPGPYRRDPPRVVCDD